MPAASARSLADASSGSASRAARSRAGVSEPLDEIDDLRRPRTKSARYVQHGPPGKHLEPESRRTPSNETDIAFSADRNHSTKPLAAGTVLGPEAEDRAARARGPRSGSRCRRRRRRPRTGRRARGSRGRGGRSRAATSRSPRSARTSARRSSCSQPELCAHARVARVVGLGDRADPHARHLQAVRVAVIPPQRLAERFPHAVQRVGTVRRVGADDQAEAGLVDRRDVLDLVHPDRVVRAGEDHALAAGAPRRFERRVRSADVRPATSSHDARR